MLSHSTHNVHHHDFLLPSAHDVKVVTVDEAISTECSRKQTFPQQAFTLTGAGAAGADVFAQFSFWVLSIFVIADLCPTSQGLLIQ